MTLKLITLAAVSTSFLASLTGCASQAVAQLELETRDLSTQHAHFDALIPGLLEAHNVPAITFAVVSSDGVEFAAAYGEARPGVPATTQSMFNMASVTKLLASETVLQIADAGLIDIDVPMAPVFVDPDVAADPLSQRLTPRHALAHQSGFPNWRSMNDGRLAFQFEPGTRPGYSGEGYNYVARYVAQITGSPFDELLRTYTLEPAGARYAAFSHESGLGDNFTWSKLPDGSFVEADMQTWSAADELYGSASAVGLVLSNMLTEGSLSAELEADRRTIQFDMTEGFCSQGPVAAICPNAMGFTLTGIAFEYADETVFWQGGGDAGESAVAFMVPERDFGMVIIANSASGRRLFSTIAEVFYDNEDFIAFLDFQGSQE